MLVLSKNKKLIFENESLKKLRDNFEVEKFLKAMTIKEEV